MLDDNVIKPVRHRIMRVHRDLLASALLLPEGTRIVDISTQAYFGTDDVAIKIERDDFDAVIAGMKIPEIVPMYSSRHTPEFAGWIE